MLATNQLSGRAAAVAWTQRVRWTLTSSCRTGSWLSPVNTFWKAYVLYNLDFILTVLSIISCQWKELWDETNRQMNLLNLHAAPRLTFDLLLFYILGSFMFLCRDRKPRKYTLLWLLLKRTFQLLVMIN